MSYDSMFALFTLGLCLGALLYILYRARHAMITHRPEPRTITTPARRASDMRPTTPQPTPTFDSAGGHLGGTGPTGDF